MKKPKTNAYYRPFRKQNRPAGAAKNALAIGLIGDGVVALLWPKRQLMLWKFGPRPYQRLTQSVARHPMVVRLIGAMELAVGLWWNRRIYRSYLA